MIKIAECIGCLYEVNGVCTGSGAPLEGKEISYEVINCSVYIDNYNVAEMVEEELFGDMF